MHRECLHGCIKAITTRDSLSSSHISRLSSIGQSMDLSVPLIDRSHSSRGGHRPHAARYGRHSHTPDARAKIPRPQPWSPSSSSTRSNIQSYPEFATSPLQHLHVVKKIGQGAFGTVYKVVYVRSSTELFSIKFYLGEHQQNHHRHHITLHTLHVGDLPKL
jgi:hypothetical protein